MMGRLPIAVLLRILICGFILVAAPIARSQAGTRAHSDLPARTLHFPADRSLGTVTFSGSSVPAQGTVQIPAGEPASLRVDAAGATDLSALSSFPSDALQSLSLTGTPTTDTQIQNIANLTGLEDLRIRQTSVTDAGAAYLQELTNLRRLDIAWTGITDEGISYLQDMTQMERISMNRVPITDEGIQYLARMENMRYLDMPFGQVTDEGLLHLQNMGQLDYLGMEGMPITDEGLRNIAHLTQLERIDLEWTGVTNEGVRLLSNMPNLRWLDLDDTAVTADILDVIAGLNNLSTLWLPPTIGADQLRALSHLPAYGNMMNRSLNQPIRIEVIDAVTGEGIPGAEVVYLPVENNPSYQDGAPIYAMATAADGLIDLYGTPNQRIVRLFAKAKGYVPAESTFPLPDGLSAAEDRVFTIVLEPSMNIGGLVVDASGTPVAGASVSIPVSGGYNQHGNEPLHFSAMSDMEGRFSMDAAPRDLGGVWVAVSHPNYSTTTYMPGEYSEAALKNGEARFVIAGAISLPGRVMDTRGVGIPDVQVMEMKMARQYTKAPTGIFAVTDALGRYNLQGIQPGKRMLRFSVPGYVEKEESVTVTTRMAEHLTTIQREVDVEIAVEDRSTGEPVFGALVRLTDVGDAPIAREELAVTTDEEGVALLRDVPSGKLRGYAELDGYERSEFTFDSDVDARTSVSLEKIIRVRDVQVVDHATGDPVPTFSIVIMEYATYGGFAKPVKRENYSTTNGVISGEALKSFQVDLCSKCCESRLVFIAHGYTPTSIRLETLTNNYLPKPYAVMLERGAPVHGRVLKADGEPAAFAAIVAGSEEFPFIFHPAEPLPGVEEFRFAATDEQGNFMLPPLQRPLSIAAITMDRAGSVTVEEDDAAIEIVMEPQTIVTAVVPEPMVGNIGGSVRIVTELQPHVSICYRQNHNRFETDTVVLPAAPGEGFLHATFNDNLLPWQILYPVAIQLTEVNEWPLVPPDAFPLEATVRPDETGAESLLVLAGENSVILVNPPAEPFRAALAPPGDYALVRLCVSCGVGRLPEAPSSAPHAVFVPGEEARPLHVSAGDLPAIGVWGSTK